jgi:hypothetical protein
MTILDRRKMGSAKNSAQQKKIKAKRKQRRNEEPTSQRESRRGKLMVALGIPRIPDELRRSMELGHEPTPEQQEQMAPYIAAAAEQFKQMHLQNMRATGGPIHVDAEDE